MEIQPIHFGDSLGQLFDWVSEIQEMHNSVLCITPLVLYNCFHPSRHTFNQLLTHLWLYSIPHLCHTLPNLPNSCCWCFILAQLQFDMMPEVFNGIKVWRLWFPVYESDIILFHPVSGLSEGVFGVIVLLKNAIPLSNLRFLYAGQ